ncbi:Threonylcarbamoyl-AMP synthase [Thalassoglobus neptunius]|uniref:Threonylcarbamoyl-AMP synthase n=1 Tax=Thalassoglobus neptunius TaxID=1938619 RepID=A0A5C5X7Z5_9PLAN|nr:L-threonylcarbamoyladenylate synthase [Thalassoglobus neptunius]TWT58451.1 Threonylcarbamoyl-AMP synthase [Thalassoglobus neptunius]
METQRLTLEMAATFLREGQLVSFGTETVYGLGANALDPVAVAKIFDAKQRPTFDPLIVHLADAADADQYAVEIPSNAQELMEAFWPGPLTLVVPKKSVIPDLVTSGLPRVALRVPNHSQARELIRRAGVPLAAPSANPFGGISPTTAQHVLDGLGGVIDGVVDFGPCRVGVESTVVGFDDSGVPIVLRPGGVAVEDLESVVGTVRTMQSMPHDDNLPQLAPGMLSRHYAPNKPLTIVEDVSEFREEARIGAISLSPLPDAEGFAVVEVLSDSGDLVEAAASFFSALRRLEASKLCDRIICAAFPDHGLGKALNDRLRRAATPLVDS